MIGDSCCVLHSSQAEKALESLESGDIWRLLKTSQIFLRLCFMGPFSTVLLRTSSAFSSPRHIYPFEDTSGIHSTSYNIALTGSILQSLQSDYFFSNTDMFSHVLLEDLSSLLQPRLYSLQGWWCQPATQTSDSFLWFVSHCMICLLELTEPIFDMPCHRTLESIKHNKCPKFEYTKNVLCPKLLDVASTPAPPAPPRRGAMYLARTKNKESAWACIFVVWNHCLYVVHRYIYIHIHRTHTHTPYTYTYTVHIHLHIHIHIHIHIYRYIDI